MNPRYDALYKLITHKLFAVACLATALGLAACEPEGKTEKAEQTIKVEKESVGQQAPKSAETPNDSLEKAGKQIDQAIHNSEKRLEVAKDSVASSTKASGEYFDDSVITAKAKAALLNDDFLKLAPIEVSTVNGAVTLRGSVDSEQLAGKAISLVSGQEHVKSVQNELSITSNQPSKQ